MDKKNENSNRGPVRDFSKIQSQPKRVEMHAQQVSSNDNGELSSGIRALEERQNLLPLGGGAGNEDCQNFEGRNTR